MNFTTLLLSAISFVRSHFRDGEDIVSPFRFPMGSAVQPMQLQLDQSFLDMTIQKVRTYRPTISFDSTWSSEGPPTNEMTAIASYWADQYDWRAIEQDMNEQFNHFMITVPGNGNYSRSLPIHFVHHRSDRDDAIPLLLLHGWPSSFLEWSKVIKPLTRDPKQSFHVVAPDLPGFGFSPAPEQPDLGPREMAGAFNSLMHSLGYKKYGISTTDLGWFVGMWMVGDVEDSIIGHMSDFFVSPPTHDDRARSHMGATSEDEDKYITSFDNWFRSHWLYATVHSQKPLALSAALGDSPVGLLGWYWDVNRETSDGYNYSYEQLITDAMMLWISGPYANTRAYREMFKPYVMNFPKTSVPTGVSEWSWSHGPSPDIADFADVPEQWIKRTVNLTYFKRHGFGGHFPAVSHPEEWVEDVTSFFSSLEASRRVVKDEL